MKGLQTLAGALLLTEGAALALLAKPDGAPLPLGIQFRVEPLPAEKECHNQMFSTAKLQNNCGSDGPYQSTAKRITALLGKPLQFYQMTHQDQTPCQDTLNWKPQGKPELVKP